MKLFKKYSLYFRSKWIPHLHKNKMFCFSETNDMRDSTVTGDLLVFFSFLMTCYQTTKFLTAGGQFNQDKTVNFD